MTDLPTSRPEGAPPELESGGGLRLRLWIACLGGSLVTASGLWWILGTRIGPAGTRDPATLVLWLVGTGALGIVVGAACALWLDARILSHLRGLTRTLASGEVHELRGLPASSGWGELSDLTQHVHHLLSARREAGRAAEELRALELQLETLSGAVERWITSEHWTPLGFEGGALAALATSLDRGFARESDVREQNREAARLLRADLDASLGDARESMEQAERGFVEATALITTVRELQRLSGELREAIEATDPGASPALTEFVERYRVTAATAIAELIAASTESVDRLGAGIARVREISGLVQTVANRSTLLALNVMVAGGRGGETPARAAERTAELESLAGDVRTATDRTDALSRAVEREVEAASTRMREVRERIGARLDEAPEPGAAPLVGAPEDVLRLNERVREMIQDATQKGERLSAAGERASRAADRLLRRLEEQAREMEGLLVRLAPPGAEAGTSPAHETGAAGRAGNLRLLESDERETGEPGTGERETGEEPGTGEREERP
jgi:hypothetical protein